MSLSLKKQVIKMTATLETDEYLIFLMASKPFSFAVGWWQLAVAS